MKPTYPTAQQIPIKRSLVTNDDANLRTMSRVKIEETMAPTERFFAKSALRSNKLTVVFCHVSDPMLDI